MEEINDITECCICTEMFTDPRMLPCIHTFCLKCLEETRSKSEKNPENTMPCPICRENFAIPPEGLSGLRKNFFMARLMEIAKISRPSECKVSCDVCLINRDEEDIEVLYASLYCVQCRENMCEICSKQHKRQKLSRDHQIVPFGSQVKDELMKTFVATYCKQHRKEELKMYCADCKTVICMMCFAESHQIHTCSDVNKVADGFRDEINVFIAKIVERLNEVLERKLKLEELKGRFLEELKSSEEAIKEKADALKQLIDKQAAVLLNELVQIKATRMKETEHDFEDIERHLTIFKSFEAFCCEIKSKGAPVEICRAVGDLRTRTKELEEAKIEQSISVIQVSFKTSSTEDVVKSNNIVGSLEVKRKSLATIKTNKASPVSVDVIKILQCSSNVQAVTKLDDKIYVLCVEWLKSGTTLRIFWDRDPFQSEKNIPIREIEFCSCVASSEKFKCLYISDSFNRCIWELKADDYRVTKWMSDIDGPFTLSISNAGHLIILSGDDDGDSKLQICGADADIIRNISLSCDIITPLHVIQESNGKFIIYHRLDNSFSGSWVISELSNEGQTLGQLHPIQKPEGPIIIYKLCLDSKYDRLFVAQRDNLKLSVVVFDLISFEWKETLLTFDEDSNRPTLLSLYFDERKKQL